MSAPSRKNSYPREFKLKVLEYYFRHGGEKKFGLKSKTAQHFCIDHKTVSRMLCNPDIVKKARRALTRKQPSSSCKTSPDLSMGQLVGDMEVDNIEEEDPGDTPSPQSMENTAGEMHNISSKFKAVPLVKPKVSPTSKFKQEKRQPSAEVSVIELPEDPDYSLLKQTIKSSASGAANIAKLLLTGTQEVKKIITNECDLIFECKVCRNLFRSVVNFLAHKRVYCQEEYTNVKSIFHKDTGLKMTSQSNTVVVEPEPPPADMSPVNDNLSTQGITTQFSSGGQKNGAFAQELSSSTNTGSSKYFDKLAKVNEARSEISKDCSVMLQDIVGVTSAVYQTFVPPNVECPDQRMQELLKEISEKKKDTAHLDVEGNIILETNESIPVLRSRSSSCNLTESSIPSEQENVTCSTCISTFSSQKLLDSHVADIHGIERTVFTCPICNMAFLSIWGCVKHLNRIHKKKKHQRERLKHVICSRSYKKMFTTKEMTKHNHRSYPHENKKSKEKGETKEEEEEPLKPDIYLPPEGISRVTSTSVEENVGSLRKKSARSCAQVRWECNVCSRRFLSHPASLAHLATHLVCDVEPKVVKVIEAEHSVIEENSLPPLNAVQSKTSNKKYPCVDSEYARLIEESFAKEKNSLICKEERPESSIITDPKQLEDCNPAGSIKLEFGTNEKEDINSKHLNQESDLNSNSSNVRIRNSLSPSVKKEERLGENSMVVSHDVSEDYKLLKVVDRRISKKGGSSEQDTKVAYSNLLSQLQNKSKEEDMVIKMDLLDSHKNFGLKSNFCAFLRNVEYEKKFNSDVDFLFDRTWLKNKKIKLTHNISEVDKGITNLCLQKKTSLLPYEIMSEMRNTEEAKKMVPITRNDPSSTPKDLIHFQDQHVADNVDISQSHSLSNKTEIENKDHRTPSSFGQKMSKLGENVVKELSENLDGKPVVPHSCSSSDTSQMKTSKKESLPAKDNCKVDKPCKFISNISLLAGSIDRSKVVSSKVPLKQTREIPLRNPLDEKGVDGCKVKEVHLPKLLIDKEAVSDFPVEKEVVSSAKENFEGPFHANSKNESTKNVDNVTKCETEINVVNQFSESKESTFSIPANDHVSVKEVKNKISRSFKSKSSKLISRKKLDLSKKEKIQSSDKEGKVKKINAFASSGKKFLKVFSNSKIKKHKYTFKKAYIPKIYLVENENVKTGMASDQQQNSIFNSYPSTSSPSTSKGVNSYDCNSLETLECEMDLEGTTLNASDLPASVTFGSLNFDENCRTSVDPMEEEEEISSGITLDEGKYLTHEMNFGKVSYDWDQL